MANQPKWMTITGWVLTGLVALMLTFSATMKFTGLEDVQKEFVRLGYSKDAALMIGIIEFTCLIVYLFPRTAVLGAVLLTGYLGGAEATHVRIHDGPDKFLAPLIGGVLVWLALFFRERRIRAILPWTPKASETDVK